MRSDVEERSERYLRDVISMLEKAVQELPSKTRDIADVLTDARHAGKNVYVMGNGGSASTASHMASDLNKGANREDAPRFKAVALTDNVPLMMAWANDSSYDDVFVEQLRNHLEEGDVVIGFSGSGNSTNVLKAVEYANRAGAVTIGITGFDGGKLARIAKISYIVPSDCMQQVEDAHLVIEHMLSVILRDSPECARKKER